MNLLATILAAVFLCGAAVAWVVVAAASLARCGRCGCWHADKEEEDLCRQS